MSDEVNSPKHYQFFLELEAIEVIARSMMQEQFYGYCLGNRLKYRLRAGNKDKLTEQTSLALSYEYFDDERLTDRGLPSDPRTNKPLDTRRSLYIGSPQNSISTVTVDAFSATLSHEFDNGATLINQTRYADYDKYYDNVFAGVYNPETELVSISSYSSATARENLINQTDLTFEINTAGINHKLLTGIEYSKQDTDNKRLTGYFSDLGVDISSTLVPLSNPVYNGV